MECRIYANIVGTAKMTGNAYRVRFKGNTYRIYTDEQSLRVYDEIDIQTLCEILRFMSAKGFEVPHAPTRGPTRLEPFDPAVSAIHYRLPPSKMDDRNF
jgi:hypothetical protein